MSIITGLYYKSDIALTSAQIDSVTTGIVSGSSWQDDNEDVILKRLLGYKLWKLYKADLTSDSPQSAQTSRFTALVDGAEFSFSYNGHTIETKFEGLRDSTTLKSLIAYYVYYQYRNETENFNSGSGQKHSSTENSVDADVLPKLVNSWNKMVNMYGQTPNCYVNKELFLDNGNYVHFNSEPSVYNFLLANLETYPEWVFEPLGKQNIFMI